MTRNETFAATALQGLIAARTNLDIQQEIETASRYADRRIIGEVLNAYGCADGAGTSFFGRCELTHCFADVCQFTFPPRTERTA